MNAAEMREMNARIALRREEIDGREDYLAVPVRGPSWSEKVLDTGTELLAIHATTGEPYPLDLRKDLSPEDAAIVIVRRIFKKAGTREEAERFLDSFGLEPNVARRLFRQLAEARP